MASWVDQLSPNDRFELARTVATRLVDHIIELVRLHESNRIVVYSPTLSRQIPRSYAAHAYNDFKDSLFYLEILRLCALWDSPKKDRESIPTALKLLESSQVLSLVDAAIEKDWNATNAWDDFGRRQVSQIQNRLRRAYRVGKEIDRGKKLKRLRAFRHKFLAHSLSPPLAEAPKYGDEGRLLSASIEIVNRIYLATYNSSFMFTSSIQHSKRCAQDLWNNCTFAIPRGG